LRQGRTQLRLRQHYRVNDKHRWLPGVDSNQGSRHNAFRGWAGWAMNRIPNRGRPPKWPTAKARFFVDATWFGGGGLLYSSDGRRERPSAPLWFELALYGVEAGILACALITSQLVFAVLLARWHMGLRGFTLRVHPNSRLSAWSRLG